MSKFDPNDLSEYPNVTGYIPIKKLGRGGFGDVYLVHSEKYEQQEFVLKQIRLPEDGKVNREVETAISLCHPNIVSIYDYFTFNGKLILIMEYCSGGSLQTSLKKTGAIKPPKLYDICRQILLAVQHCHINHIAHRDIKPANILLDKYGRVKLSDFGLSSVFTPGQKIREFSGTSVFMAPEIHSHRQYDPFLADIWALGVTFYDLAAGCLPWNNENIADLRSSILLGIFDGAEEIEPRMMALLTRMLDNHPPSRPSINDILRNELFLDNSFKVAQGGIRSYSSQISGFGHQSLLLKKKKLPPHKIASSPSNILLPQSFRQGVNITPTIIQNESFCPSQQKKIKQMATIDTFSPYNANNELL